MRIDGLLVIDKAKDASLVWSGVKRSQKRRATSGPGPIRHRGSARRAEQGTNWFLSWEEPKIQAVIKQGGETEIDREVILKTLGGVTSDTGCLSNVQGNPTNSSDVSAVKIDGKPLYRWARKSR
jgi:hypothetical protein